MANVPADDVLLAAYDSFEETSAIPIPKNPLEQVIGQKKAVEIAKIAATQRRNLLLVGPPGIGKSLLAQAISFHLPLATEEVNVLHNPENPERPSVEVKTRDAITSEQKMFKKLQGHTVDVKSVPPFVAERLGFRCRRCGRFSSSRQSVCPNCGVDKFVLKQAPDSPFGDLNPFANYLGEHERQDQVRTTRIGENGREEIVHYERQGEKIRVLDQKFLEKLDAMKKKTPRKVIVPLDRKNFVIATGASETELLGDVRHDPYGSHPGLGTPPYQRVLPGSVHEAHQGVLFIDEISAMSYMQRFLLTAMQEKKYHIIGRNPHSAGASVKVEDVPCDFILIAASNINDLQHILPPLRSRILGNGYEVLLDTSMPDTIENRAKLAQFTAQEIRKDGKLPHASRDAVNELTEEARRRAKQIDGTDNALTLRLRELSGIIRLAGDIAVGEGAELLSREFVRTAVGRAKPIEEQLKERYGSLYKAQRGDVGANETPHDQKEIS